MVGRPARRDREPALIGLDAAIRLLLSVGIDRIEARVDTLTTRLCRALESEGYVVVSPRQPGEGSGIVSFVSRTAASREVARALRSRSITVSVRDELVRGLTAFLQHRRADQAVGGGAASLSAAAPAPDLGRDPTVLSVPGYNPTAQEDNQQHAVEGTRDRG